MVGRIQKDLNGGNTLIGGILTSTNRTLDQDIRDLMHKSAYSGGLDFTQYFKDKNWVLNINSAFTLVEGSRKAIEITQRSSAHYFQRPDKNYSVLDTNKTSLTGTGGRMHIMKLNGHWNFMSNTTWKSPGFETNDLGYLREADQILSVLWAQYNQYEPNWIYRKYNVNWDIYSIWNFGGTNISKGFEWNASMEMKNFWNIYAGGALRSGSLDQSILRGGPVMKTPGNTTGRIGFNSDNRKKLILNGSFNSTIYSGNCAENYYYSLGLSFKPTNWLVVSFNPGFNKSFSELQYVTGGKVNGENKYIFASIDRKTVNTSFRINLNISPDLTLQYWGQPFFATGRFFNQKMITNPVAAHFSDRFHTYSNSQISNNNGSYDIDENSDGTTDYSFNNMDFNVQEFLSNLVVRWEYNPGSSLYLVWCQTRSSSGNSGNMDIMDDLGNLFNPADNKPHNVFLVKFTYRFGLK
jgi:hypothetical protein